MNELVNEFSKLINFLDTIEYLKIVIKKQLEEQANYTVEDYTAFLSDMFAKVDEEDRHGEVTFETSFSFKLVGDLIDVLTFWGPVPDEWVKKSKRLRIS